MIICDSHIHSEFSSDSSAPLDSIIQQAIQLGIPKICLTDHHDIDFPINREDGFYFHLDFDSFFAAIDEIRHRYGDRIDVRSGVELGLMNIWSSGARLLRNCARNRRYRGILQGFFRRSDHGRKKCTRFRLFRKLRRSRKRRL